MHDVDQYTYDFSSYQISLRLQVLNFHWLFGKFQFDIIHFDTSMFIFIHNLCNTSKIYLLCFHYVKILKHNRVTCNSKCKRI